MWCSFATRCCMFCSSAKNCYLDCKRHGVPPSLNCCQLSRFASSAFFPLPLSKKKPSPEGTSLFFFILSIFLFHPLFNLTMAFCAEAMMLIREAWLFLTDGLPALWVRVYQYEEFWVFATSMSLYVHLSVCLCVQAWICCCSILHTSGCILAIVLCKAVVLQKVVTQWS